MDINTLPPPKDCVVTFKLKGEEANRAEVYLENLLSERGYAVVCVPQSMELTVQMVTDKTEAIVMTVPAETEQYEFEYIQDMLVNLFPDKIVLLTKDSNTIEVVDKP